MSLSPCCRFHPAEVNIRIGQSSAAHAAFALRWQDHPCGLASNRAGADSDGTLAAHAACRVPDKCDDHCRHWRLVLAARRSSPGGPGDAALEPWIGGSLDPDPALLRTSDR